MGLVTKNAILLVDFINLGTFYPCRMEYNDYLRWVAAQFTEQSRYGEEVLTIEPVLHNHQVEALRVISRGTDGQQFVRTARSVVVSAGGPPSANSGSGGSAATCTNGSGAGSFARSSRCAWCLSSTVRALRASSGSA